LPLIEDIQMKIDDQGNEYTEIKGSDLVMCQDAYALWQAFEGELKTPLGACKGWMTTNYGSRLPQLIGSNLTFDILEPEVKDMIVETAGHYSQIGDVEIDINSDDWTKGIINATVTLYTVFGQITENFTYNTGNCD
jgi:phage baseplate assembly protein W